MKHSPFLITISKRFIFLFALIMGGVVHPGISQIPVMVVPSADGRQYEKSLHIQWSIADEAKWHNDNDGRLDIMSLKTDITTDLLHPEPNGSTSIRLQFDRPCRIECLIRINVNDAGESVYLYDRNSGTYLGDLKPSGKQAFLTPSFDPATTSIIWKVREGTTPKSDITISNIYYEPLQQSRNPAIGFGTALPCHPNAACKVDSLSRLISSSDVRIRLVMEEGIGWCSGTLMNTTRNDKTPFLLTAYHCTYGFTPYYDMWRFDFEYASPDCPNPPEEPQYFSLTGCQLKASGQSSDFLLVLLDNVIPVDEQVTFAGWDRDSLVAPDTTYLVHHPNADIRKFSTCTDSATIHPYQIGWSEGYSTPAYHHFRLKFTEGGHEKGSSGGGAFNQDFHLIGQLHGGIQGCEEENTSYIGRLAKSWNLGTTPSGRLKDWLDPDNTGLTKLESVQNISAGDIINLHGVVVDPAGRPVTNVKIHVTGSVNEEMTTGADGQFSLPNMSRFGHYTFTPEKNNNPANGLNVFDLLAIQKHLLAKELFTEDWQLIAADATNNGEITVGDILIILKLILGKIQYFPSSPAWRFSPSAVDMDMLPPGPQNEIRITGIKIGDVDGTANPGL